MTYEELTTITTTTTTRLRRSLEHLGETPTDPSTVRKEYDLPTQSFRVNGNRVTIRPTGIEAWDGRSLRRYPRGQGWTPRTVAARLAA